MGWLGTCFTLLGAWTLAGRKQSALVLMMLGNFCWAYEGFVIQKPDLIVINVALFVVAVRNFYRWGRT